MRAGYGGLGRDYYLRTWRGTWISCESQNPEARTFILGLIADKLFDSGSGLLAFWIGVPVR